MFVTEEMVLSQLQLTIDESDPFPKSACIPCWLGLKLANKIKANFLESDKKLQSLLLRPDLFNGEGSIPDSSLLNIIKGVSNENSVLEEDNKALFTIESSTNDTDETNLDIDCENMEQEENQSSSVETLKIENMTNSEIFIFFVNGDAPVEEINCRICGECLHESEEMNHVKQHFEIKDNCQVCEIECQNLGSLRRHLKKEHNQDMEEVYTCENCSASFQYKALYKLHKEKAHVNEEEDIETTEKLNGPGKEHNDNIKTHDAQNVSCDICKRSFKHKDSLRGHKTNYHSTNEFPCEFCDEVFKIKYSRKLHVKQKHTGVDFECKQCGKAFVTLFRLKQHINHVHLKNWKYKCSYCETLCSTRWNLKAHQRQHLDARPYVCVHCGVGFRRNLSLKHHLESKH